MRRAPSASVSLASASSISLMNCFGPARQPDQSGKALDLRRRNRDDGLAGRQVFPQLQRRRVHDLASQTVRNDGHVERLRPRRQAAIRLRSRQTPRSAATPADRASTASRPISRNVQRGRRSASSAIRSRSIHSSIDPKNPTTGRARLRAPGAIGSRGSDAVRKRSTSTPCGASTVEGLSSLLRLQHASGGDKHLIGSSREVRVHLRDGARIDVRQGRVVVDAVVDDCGLVESVRQKAGVRYREPRHRSSRIRAVSMPA